MKIIGAGLTGFIGSGVVSQLVNSGHEIVILTRSGRPAEGRTQMCTMKWDGESLGSWATVLNEMDVIINLAGENIAAKRWTARQKSVILNSRLRATEAIVKAIKAAKTRPKLLISASAVGFYGAVAEGEVDESFPQGEDFLAKVCGQWEVAAKKAQEAGTRVVLLRIGVVLGSGGGALAKMLPPFKWCAGGPLGSGKQWFPWIHKEDVCKIINFAIENSKVSGPINVTAPNPVRMKEFCSVLGQVLGRPSWAPVPAPLLKILLGDMADMLITGQKALPRKLTELGYSFHHSTLRAALESILSRKFEKNPQRVQEDKTLTSVGSSDKFVK